MAWRGRLAAAALALGAAPGAVWPSSVDDYVVVVNASNPVSALSREELSRIFLRKVTRWPDGRGITAVDLVESSPVRGRFSTEVHGRPAGALRAYWQQKIYSGTGLPPITKPSDETVLALVQENPGAIGYVSAAAPLPTGAKPVKLAE